MHQTIKKVTEDVKEFHYNTAIAGIMEYVNALKKDEQDISKENILVLCQLLAPLTPHLAEEVWREVLGNPASIHVSSWPQFDEAKIIPDKIIVAIQINGKLRSQIEISEGEVGSEEKVVVKAMNSEAVQKWLAEVKVKKTIYVKGKILNFVTNS
jgi:leucyl-tRNA synthetase